MKGFLQAHALVFTPLTPIHIGCGMDFDPTNYVIDGGALYHFEPSAVPLPAEDRRKLIAAVGNGDADAPRRVQRFFFERKEVYVAGSRGIIAVSPGVASQYEQRIGQVAQRETTGGVVINALEIERTTHHPHTGTPYIPGSSIKGAVRTAWLHEINKGHPAQGGERANDMEQRLLGGRFQTDPFRLIRFSDASGRQLQSKVVFATNHKKRPVLDKDGKPSVARGLAARREAVVGGQYRSLSGEVRFDSLDGKHTPDTPNPAKRISGFTQLAAACNRFYAAQLQRDLALMAERRFSSDEWIAAFGALISTLQPALNAGEIMLVRVGRHSGAESVTLPGARSIRIMKGPVKPAETGVEATTIWLAADAEDSRSGMLPFGWLLVEPAQAVEQEALQKWCAAQEIPKLDAARTRRDTARSALEAERERQRAAAAEKAAHETAAAEAERARAARVASLGEHGKAVEALREKLEGYSGPTQPVSGALYADLQKLIRQSSEEGWSAEDRRALAEVIETLGFKKIRFDSKEREIRRAVRALRGEA